MVITCTVSMAPEDSFAFTPDEAAAKIMQALAGDPAKDHCQVSLSMAPQMGRAGTQPDIFPPLIPSDE
jgi:hypothetical protein